jgi:hypothetical protein
MSETSYESPDAEIESIRARLGDAGYDLALTRNGSSWLAELASRGNQVGSGPVVEGNSAIAAARKAWTIFLATPSLNSLRRPARHLA